MCTLYLCIATWHYSRCMISIDAKGDTFAWQHRKKCEFRPHNMNWWNRLIHVIQHGGTTSIRPEPRRIFQLLEICMANVCLTIHDDCVRRVRPSRFRYFLFHLVCCLQCRAGNPSCSFSCQGAISHNKRALCCSYNAGWMSVKHGV